MKFRFSLAAASLLALSALTAPIATAQDELNGAPDTEHDKPAHGRGRTRNQIGHASTGTVVQGNGINYNGGPVMHGTVNVYFIWYGTWGAEYTKASAIINDWANAIGSSPYENINTTYGDTTGNVSGQIHYGGFALDAGSQGTSLSDNSIAAIVSSALASQALPVDTNGVYMVLTAPGVKETSGFLTQYCGWHTYGTYNGNNIKYAFIGDASGPSLGACAEQTASSPNGDPAVDAMISVMSHELEESASDPNLNAWYDASGEENADKCAWTFGTTYQSNGAMGNMHLGTRDFLIQRNWLNLNGGSCTLAYNPAPNFSLSVSPASQSVAPGGTTGSYTVTATALNGYKGTPIYNVTGGLPSGATASVAANLITIATTTATAAGTYVFTITGKDSGAGLTNTTTATLVVNAPLPPSFTLSMSPSSAVAKRPGPATYTVTIMPVNNFTGAVALSASPAKTGLIVYSFSPITSWRQVHPHRQRQPASRQARHHHHHRNRQERHHHENRHRLPASSVAGVKLREWKQYSPLEKRACRLPYLTATRARYSPGNPPRL